jgi:sodium-dependent dicarboxylate transporter 2/3/5
MLFPVAIAIARTTGALMNPGSAESDATPRLRYTTGMLLMLAFAGSVGGLATPIGTPPNLIGIALIDQGLKVRIGFFQWMLFGLPVALVMLGVIYGVILALYRPEVRYVPGQLERMRSAQRELGPWTAGQINCVAAFGAAVVLWIAPGLLSLALGAGHPLAMLVSERLTEGTVALLAASLLFVLPADWGRREFTLEWEEAALIDWGTVLLFGGGIALGRLIFETGLAVAMGDGILALFGAESPSVLSAAAVLLAAMISEASSNTASASTVVPVMLSIGKSAGQAPISVALAATLGSSLGFMLPVSTPCNAIVYGSGRIPLTAMMRYGVVLDVAGIVAIVAVVGLLGPLVLR